MTERQRANKRPGKAAAVAAPLVIGALLLWAIRPAAEPVERIAGRGAFAAPQSASEASGPLATSIGAEREAVDLVPASPEESAWSRGDGENSEAPPGVRFHGTLELRDHEDAVLPPQDAEIGVLALSGDEHAAESVPLHIVSVRAGSFEATIPAARRFLLERVDCGGRVAWLAETWFEADGEPLALVARCPRPTTLRVTDAGSGALLDGVFVVEPKTAFERPGPDQCPPDELIVRAAASPLQLALPDPAREEALRWLRRVVVGAPGYASASVDLDLTQGGERLVPLEPGANVNVALEPWRPSRLDPAEGVLVRRPPEPRVRLRHITDLDPERSREETLVSITRWMTAAEAVPDAAGRVRFEGVAPGPCTVSVELGDWRSREPALAYEQFELAAGETRSVTLPLPELPDLKRAAPLAGMVEVSPDWDDLPWALEIRGMRDDDPRRLRLSRSELEAVAGAAGRWRFRIDAVTPGEWIARFTVIEQQQVFEQPEGGRDDLLLAVGKPVAARFELRDAATRELVDVGDVTLRPVALDARINQWSMLDTEHDLATRSYAARLAPGDYELSFEDWRYAEPKAPISVAAERPIAAVDLSRNGGLRVRLRVGDTVLPTSEVVERVRLVWPDGRGAARRFHYERERVRIVPSRLGSCTLTIDPPPGCLAPPARSIEIEEGEFVEVDVVLERE